MFKQVIIVAGGSGTRFGTRLPKQFLKLNGKEVFLHSMEPFYSIDPSTRFILVFPAGYIKKAENILLKKGNKFDCRFAAGGETRYNSVKNGLEKSTDEGLIIIHDAVRPLLSRTLVERVYKGAMANGSAIPVVGVRDSVRIVRHPGNEALNRDQIRLVQTPQCFLADRIRKAYHVEYNVDFTDDASVYEALGYNVHLVEGEINNIKITTPDDWAIAKALKPGKKNRTE